MQSHKKVIDFADLSQNIRILRFCMIKTLAPILAITTVLSSTAAVESFSIEPVFASAQSIESRVEQRRARRQGVSSFRRPAASSVRRLRRNTRRVIRIEEPVRTPLLQRREARLKRRLAGRPVPVKEQLLQAVNTERAQMGIAPLRYHSDLETAAQGHALDMMVREYFDHESPEGNRVKFRAQQTGYGVINAQECHCSFEIRMGENIAKGQTTVAQVVRDWMESPSHREAMLDVHYKEVGVGIVDDIWVLNFGSVVVTPIR